MLYSLKEQYIGTEKSRRYFELAGEPIKLFEARTIFEPGVIDFYHTEVGFTKDIEVHFQWNYVRLDSLTYGTLRRKLSWVVNWIKRRCKIQVRLHNRGQKQWWESHRLCERWRQDVMDPLPTADHSNERIGHRLVEGQHLHVRVFQADSARWDFWSAFQWRGGSRQRPGATPDDVPSKALVCSQHILWPCYRSYE